MRLLKITLLGCVILSCIFTLNKVELSNYFPIKVVRIYGLNRVDRKEVQNLLYPLVDKGFFSINVDSIRERLLQIPWIANIAVRRNWPDQVDITIVEKSAIARWNNQNLLSEMGELFSPDMNTYPSHLPQFIGPNGQQVMMLTTFNQINRLFMPLNRQIAYLEMTPYFTWKLVLDNGMMLQIGHKDILTRLDHFVKVYPKIIGSRTKDVEYVDLRYPNGMAVRWKTRV